MKRSTIAVVCLSGAFALSPVVATGASAETLPAFYQCVATKKVGKPAKYAGHYSGKHCEETTYDAEGGQKYELEPWNEADKGRNVKTFKAKAKVSYLEVRGIGPITCSKSRDTGEVTGPKTLGDIQIVLTGCVLNKVQCHNTATANEIVTKALKGEVGYFDEVFGKPVARRVGLDLTPESGSKEVVEVECERIPLWVEGSVIGEVVPPYNVFTKETTLKFEQSAGRQAIQSLEGMPNDTLLTQEPCDFWCPPIETSMSGELGNKGEELDLRA